MLVIFGSGILGTELKDFYKESSNKIIHINRKHIDLEKASISDVYNALDYIFKSTDTNFFLEKNVLINATAYTNVDKAEKEKDKAFRVNASGPHVLASYCKSRSIKLVHVSTDFVFDGKKSQPYIEYDQPNPINYYGYTKLAGERFIKDSGCDYAILRTAWLYNDACGIVPRFIQLVKEGKKLSGIRDQTSAPTHAKDLAQQIDRVISFDLCGTFHATPQGRTTPCDLLEHISKKLYGNINNISDTVTYTFFSERAHRPSMCLLYNFNLNSLGLNLMPNWETSVNDLLKKQI